MAHDDLKVLEILHMVEHPLWQLVGPGIAVVSVLADAQEHLDPGHPSHALIEQAKILVLHFRLGINRPEPDKEST